MSFEFSRQEIDKYLKELAVTYKKMNRRSTGVEIILIGGASVIVNYGFRDITTDIDAIILADSVMKDAIRAVAEKNNLPEDWLNDDFKRSTSFTNKLIQHSEYYRTYANVVEVRTVREEYLIAMKLVAGRNYKRDLSDIVGIVQKIRKNGRAISWSDIDAAMIELYGGWELVDDLMRHYAELVLEQEDLTTMYLTLTEIEDKNRRIRFADAGGVTTEGNIIEEVDETEFLDILNDRM